MAEDGYEELFTRAAAIAGKVPEAMQDAAFRRALDLLLEDDGASKQTQRSKRPKKARGTKAANDAAASGETENDPAGFLIANLNRTTYPQITDADKVLDKALWLLRIANEDFSIDGLSATEIAKVLKEKFRVRCTRQGVGQALDKASRLVDRDNSGSSVRYRIMAPGEQYLDQPQTEGTKPASRSRPRAKAKAAKTARGKQPKEKGRPTPFSLLEGLVGSGFFENPRTIGDIRSYMEENQGRRYKASELSPSLLRLLRSGQLTRSKNDENQYEYSSN